MDFSDSFSQCVPAVSVDCYVADELINATHYECSSAQPNEAHSPVI